MKKLVRGSTATYQDPDGSPVCDVDEVAQSYSQVGNVPETVGWLKACEISMLARHYLAGQEEIKQLKSALRTMVKNK